MNFNSKLLAELKAEIRTLSPMEAAIKYFEQKLPQLIKNQPVGDCWSYHRKNQDGYGLLNVLGKDHRLHRLSFIYFNGPLKDGEWALHKCNTANCWRPDHLYSGSGADNALDRVADGAHRGKLPDEVVFQIKRWINEGLSPKEIAERAGVTPGCVYLIRSNKRRKDVA